MSEELRPCPFCGSEQPQDSKDDGNVPYEFGMSRSCKFCSAAVNLGWNNRPIEDELHARIARLEEAQRWIPVSEPPKTDGTYLLRNIYEDVYSCDFIADTNTWVLSEYDSITHWMPLPKLPEVK